MYVNFAKPYTMNGCTSMLSTLPINLTEIKKYEGSLLYMFLLLIHRTDFQISLQQIPSICKLSRGIFTGLFKNEECRELWRENFKTILLSYFDDEVLKMSYSSIIDNFFKNDTPSIPGIAQPDLNNEASFHSELPPKPQNVGMAISYGGKFVSNNYGWRNRLPENPFFTVFDIDKDDEKKSIKIQNVHLINGYWNHNELSIVGKKELDIFVYEKTLQNYNEIKTVKACVYDGDEFIGFINLPCSGDRKIWNMSAVRISLPKPNSE